jgi:hypothetical protein
MGSTVVTVLFLFLAGYWFGWQTTSARSIKSEASPVAMSHGNAPGKDSQGRLSTAGEAVDAQGLVVRLARMLQSGTDNRANTIRMVTEVAALSQEEVYAALTELKSAPRTGPLLTLRAQLVKRLAELDPQAAYDYARQAIVARDSAGGQLLASVFQRWAYSDPVAALRTWRDFRASGSADFDEVALMRSDYYGLGGIFYRLGKKDLGVALSEVTRLTADEQKQAWFALSPLAAQEAARGQMLDALNAQPPGSARTTALAQAIEMWARSAGQRDAALQYLDSGKLSAAEKTAVEERLFRTMADTRSEGADWFVGRAQTPEQRSERLNYVIQTWAYEDPVAAGNWLNNQGLDAGAAKAMASYARTVAARYPEAAVEWVRRIPDEAVRQRAFAQVEARIRQNFPLKADALLKPAM